MSDLGTLDPFPKDIVLVILGFLDKRSLFEFSLVSHRARELMLIGLSKTAWMDRFMIKAYSGRFSLFLKLLSLWKNPGYHNNDIMRWASRDDHFEVVELLLKNSSVDPSIDNNYVIRWASKNGRSEIVKLLLKDKRVDPSVCDDCAILLASHYGHLEVVKILLSDGRVNPAADNNYAIKTAFRNGHLEIVKLLKRVRKL